MMRTPFDNLPENVRQIITEAGRKLENALVDSNRSLQWEDIHMVMVAAKQDLAEQIGKGAGALATPHGAEQFLMTDVPSVARRFNVSLNMPKRSR